ncbi:uncharacterized protein Z518_02444 [Rhinocladiella mackenziei CBS 650.93]|uniref:CFEM domain-containing protein n=1 Tax=Rhinocladiella mackenziei CBS 650.93 TaxID=1442369 RepID=A0A0D2JF12_9EURO|nr:uncharacterized protein Z518_02444 [Rhinocladiella mackenziei CBS 650.93]KIX07790.1 hypothetical protein Z518_02444 [Rhinocladiella mackenziei CBS 650.93]
MKSLAVGLIALALAIPALTQDITSLPQCAQQPILEAISASGCPLTDIACICDNDNFINGLVQLIPTLCNPDEVAVTSEFAVTLCSAYGVQLDLPTSATEGLASSTAVSTSPAPSATTTTTTSATAATSTEFTSSEPITTVEPTMTSETAPPSMESTETTSFTETTASTEVPSSTDATETTEASASESGAPAQQTDNSAMANTVGVSNLFGVVAVCMFAAM